MLGILGGVIVFALVMCQPSGPSPGGAEQWQDGGDMEQRELWLRQELSLLRLHEAGTN